jgi:uncharacterized protein (DUF111 family)
MQIETNLDDLSPQLAGVAMDRLFAAGALDVFFTAAQMKKNRPGFILTVLCTEEKSSELARILLTETTAFGVRMHRARRLKLRREFHVRETPYGPVRIKLGLLGDQLVQVVPEYESRREAAERAGVSVRDVHIAGWVGASPKLESPASDWNREGIDHGSRNAIPVKTWRRFASETDNCKICLPRRLHRTHCQC